MSFSLHVRKKNIVQYSDTTFFNHEIDEIRSFLSESLNYTSYIEESFYSVEMWEIKREDIINICIWLKEIYDNQDQYVTKHYTAKQMYDILDDILVMTSNKKDFSDPEYIYLDWF